MSILDILLDAVQRTKEGTPLRTHNEAKVMAYQLIQPADLGMSGFAERLTNRPAWQEVVKLLRLGRDEEAQEKARAIRMRGNNT